MAAEDRRSRVATLASIVVASAAAVANAGADYPNYPPTPTVIEYTVDPSWPQRPAELGPRAAVPSIAVDQLDRVWCLERGKVPVQVYTSQGELVASWGQGQFEGPHSLRFDRQDDVWGVDYEAHFVKKFTPRASCC